MQRETSLAIATMLTGLSQSNTDVDTQLKAFMIACLGYREDAIREVCTRFIRGKVKGHRVEFAPTSAQFGVECEAVHKEFEARDYIARRKQISPPPEQGTTPEHRAKMLEQMALLSKAMKGDEAAKEKLGMT